MQHTVFQFVVHCRHQGVVVEHEVARDGVNRCIDVSAQHGTDGHAVAHVNTHHLRVEQMEQGDVPAERIGKSFEPLGGHTVVGQVCVAHVVVEAVHIFGDGLVGRSKAGIGAVGREDLVVADACENIVEVTELIFTILQVILNGLARKRVQVRLVYLLTTATEEPCHDGNHGGQQHPAEELSGILLVHDCEKLLFLGRIFLLEHRILLQ